MRLRPWHTDRAVIEEAAAEFQRSGISSLRTVTGLLELIQLRTGLPVQVRENDDPELEAFAVLFPLPDRSMMILRKRDRNYRKARGLFHECAHLLFAHEECVVFSHLASTYSAPLSSVPDPDVDRRFAQESQAEALAVMIERHLSRPGFYHDEQVF